MCRPSLNDINCSIRKIVDTLIPPTFYAQQSFRTLSTTYSNHIAQLVGSRFCHNTACCVSFTHSRVWFVLGLIINIVDMFLQYQSKSSQQCFSTMFFTISTPILRGVRVTDFPLCMHNLQNYLHHCCRYVVCLPGCLTVHGHSQAAVDSFTSSLYVTTNSYLHYIVISTPRRPSQNVINLF